MDLQTRYSAGKGKRRQWGNAAIARLRQRGYIGAYHNVRSGGEIDIAVPEDCPRFFLHLDIYTPRFYQEHAHELEETFERRRPLSLPEMQADIGYFVESPEDLVANKLKRPLHAKHIGRLCPEDQALVTQLTAGGIDDVDVGDLEERLSDTLALRGLGMEEITRQGFGKAVEMIEHYKDQKDIYDILLLIKSDRQTGGRLFTDKRLIKDGVEHYLSSHPFHELNEKES